MNAAYEILTEPKINRELFFHFHRHQEVTRCWRKVQGNWVLKDISFVEEWNDEQYEFLIKCLKNTINMGGFVFGAFIQGKLVGFSSVENCRFGSRHQYVQLSCIHVSCEKRGAGIGKGLFQCAVAAAKKLGAAKLYISSHPAEETQAFYHSLGCVEAEEYNNQLTEAEPCDCQLEYLL